MSDYLPQLDDPMVRVMAECHHEPGESWTIGGRLISLHCRGCYQSWPCATRKLLDAMDR